MTSIFLDKDADTIYDELQEDKSEDYQEEEYILLGKAIKYAGIFGKEIKIFGNNRESLNK